MKKSKIYPVIHYHNLETTFANVDIAVQSGCDGVILIHMNAQDELLSPACRAIKEKYNNLFVGINRLSFHDDPSQGIYENLNCGADATWVDNSGIFNGKGSEKTDRLYNALGNSKSHQLFAAVAFKYQKTDYKPNESAQLAFNLGFLPTTSGIGTGHAPEVQKIKEMGELVGRENLAIASGITPDNVALFTPYCANFLVSTGISKSFYEFDLQLTKALVENASK